MKRKFTLAFSLIELMISLVIVSLIAAAFSPVITKRIKNDVVAVGSAVSSIRAECEDFNQKGGHCSACIDKLCILCDINCTSDQYKNIGKCECENCASKSNGCLSCNSKDCTKCQSGYYLNSEKKCSPCPAGSSCDGLNQTQCEAGFYQDEQGKGDCKPCFTNDGKYSAKGATSCSSCSAGTYPVDKNWEWHWDGQYHYGIACANCPAGYYCPDGKNAIACLASNNKYTNAQNQTSCKSCPAGQFATDDTVNWGANIRGIRCGTCGAGWACPGGDSVPYICPNGTYQDREGQGSCKNSSYGANCIKVDSTTGACTQCNAGYKISGYGCVPEFYCTGQAFVKIGNLCVTKYNMGDNEENLIPSAAGVTGYFMSNSGDKRDCDSSGKCCWSGSTSSNCDMANGDYSGCYRTICTWKAANAICANYNKNGKTWRLPKSKEMENWLPYTVGKGSNGLMLCDDGSAKGGLTKCDYSGCAGGIFSYCQASYVHADVSGTVGWLYDGNWHTLGSRNSSLGYSVRCVTDI